MPPTGKRKFVDFVRQLKFPEHFISGGSISVKKQSNNWFVNLFKKAPKPVVEPSISAQLVVEPSVLKHAPKPVMEPSISVEPIAKPSIRLTEKFEEAHGDARLDNDGYLCVCESEYSPSWGCVFGTRIYSKGVHNIRMKVEGDSAVLGILSNSSEPKECPSFYNTPGTYGWFTNGHDVVMNGITRKKKNKWTPTSKENNIYEFTLDCDGHRLRIVNEKSGARDEISVDLNQTAFPWRLFVVITSFDVVCLF
jgi:hypothetical protein